jgi:2'-5' RNA ligase
VPFDAPGSTAIVILTPEAEPLIGELYRAHSNAGSDGMTPHVTLLVPFVPAPELDSAVASRLRGVCQCFAPFDYVLARFKRFADDVLYIAPEPPEPFTALVRALSSEFPDYPPYEGIHNDVVPHVTVADNADQELFGAIAAELETRLPLACRAEVATLVERSANLQWRRRAGYPLGG